jgi:hypothetical protein
MEPHRQPRRAADLLAELTPGGQRLVAVGQYSPAPHEVERAFVIDVEREPSVLADLWMAPAEIAALATALGARRAETDAMYATAWQLAWTVGTGACVWDHRGKRAWIERGRLHVERDAIAIADVRAVEVYLKHGAVQRGVRVLLASGERRVIAKQHDPIVALDPTYDDLQLFCDTAWARSLGGSLAGALGVPLRQPD